MHRVGTRSSYLLSSFGSGTAILAILVAWPLLKLGQVNATPFEANAEREEIHRTVLGTSARADTSIQQAQVGAQVPDFEVEHLRDSTRAHTPSDFEGQYVLLNLWATWCAPCIDKIPVLQTVRQRYSDETLAILNVSFDRDRSSVVEMVNDRGIPGKHAFVGISALGGDFGAKFAQINEGDKSVRGLPNLTLVNPNGQVIATLGPTDERGLVDLLETHLP